MRSIASAAVDLVNRGDGENRLALIERLVRQRALGAAQVGKVVGRQDRLDAGHRERGARVDAADARVRHRAEEQLREQHALDAIVLRILRAAGHLGDEVGRRVVLADELLVRHGILGSANYSRFHAWDRLRCQSSVPEFGARVRCRSSVPEFGAGVRCRSSVGSGRSAAQRQPMIKTTDSAVKRPRPAAQLAWLSLAMFLGMTLWFSATAANAPIVAEFGLSPTETAWLTMAVQGGFVGGTLLSALLNLPDIINPRRLFAIGCVIAAAANAGARARRWPGRAHRRCASRPAPRSRGCIRRA